MKLEALFKVNDNKLFWVKDNTPADVSSFEKITVKWSEVELDDEVYNEEFLANLRDQLKALDSQNKFAILIPEIDKPFENPAQKEAFTTAMNHTARRVKDCVSVAGFELPALLLKEDLAAGKPAIDFMDTLAVSPSSATTLNGCSRIFATLPMASVTTSVVTELPY